MIYCGIDWAEQTHDVALVDDSGQLLAKRHIADDAVGYRILLNLLAEYGDTEDDSIPVAIETSRGLLVAVLRTLKLTIIVDTWVSDHYGDPHAEAHTHHPAA
ncbi:IS110 family transposase [Streptomyces sp. NRRL S-646]|uniref:IS110 family transposase n=1 Tax=Streptomyces sp. NRRL S-646 TaxID=1463917 RepID=UPI0004C9CE24